MTIYLNGISKRFQKNRIFKNVTLSFNPTSKYALLGANGSGKSTLLRIIAGMQSASSGKVSYSIDGKEDLAQDTIYRHISFCAPGMEIVEDLTLNEFLKFHFGFKKILDNLTIDNIVQLTGLASVADEQIANYSSGMKQRVKLAQAFFSDTPVLLLDEPCTNLDTQGVAQYNNWLSEYTVNRLVIVASNDLREYESCPNHILMETFK
jgi:ABC-type multidrug transport system ATPase subunit